MKARWAVAATVAAGVAFIAPGLGASAAPGGPGGCRPIRSPRVVLDESACPPASLPGCPDAGRAAVADKAAQRFWLCADGVAVTTALPMTTGGVGYALPPVGVHPITAKLEQAGGLHGEQLERFVAFYRTPRGNRIAFHEVVNQDPQTVGRLDQRGASAGCFRLREADSWTVWNHLQVGDPVVVITP